MNTIHLHGELKEFGGPYQMAVSSPREAFLALCTQLEGFEKRVVDGAFRIVRLAKGKEVEVDEGLLDLNTVEAEIHVYPAVAGAGGRGLGKMVLGIAIVGASIVTAGAAAGAGASLFGAGGAMAASTGFLGITYGGIAAFGTMLALGGLSMMFAPSPKAPSSQDRENNSSYILGQPQNTQEQGGVMQCTYGRDLVGSITISSDLTTAQLLQQGGASGNRYYDADESWAGGGFPQWPGTRIDLV